MGLTAVESSAHFVRPSFDHRRMNLWYTLLLLIHDLVGGLWLGIILFVWIYMYPRARGLFAEDRDLEIFFLTLVDGSRWTVLAVCGAIGLSGIGMVAAHRGTSPSVIVVALLAIKGAILTAAAWVVTHISWKMWPARVFATNAELPRIRRRFLVVALLMVALLGSALVLGIVVHECWT